MSRSTVESVSRAVHVSGIGQRTSRDVHVVESNDLFPLTFA
ncbi:hypothetical protein [Rhizohabitans arisaemae]|nr:hypothetical protein [Rhizohabitans arisaemae]